MTGSRIPSSPSSSSDQDRLLPIANVSRMMKKCLPENAKISKEAKESVQECVSEFISFVTGEASDKCQKEKRKTVNGDDLLWAMTTLGFDKYVGPLKAYLSKYREFEGEHNNSIAIQDDHAKPAPGFLMGFDGGNYHDHGGVVLSGYTPAPSGGFEFGKLDGN
ncbi:hypothetical protein ACS0TY_031443 [Phlomoides rotata]